MESIQFKAKRIKTGNRDMVSFEIEDDSLKKIVWDMIEKHEAKKTNEYKVQIRTDIETRRDCASRLFHTLRDKLAVAQAVDKEKMKTDLKIAYGVKTSYKEYTLLKSTSKYTIDEMSNLINGTLAECFDNGINIESERKEWLEVRKDET